jgi:hypothetical protein
MAEVGDVVRAYVRGSGRRDYIRMGVGADRVFEVFFADELAAHRAALRVLLGEAAQVRILAGRPHYQQVREFWQRHAEDARRIEEALCANPAVTSYGVGWFDGWYAVEIGVDPYAPAVVDELMQLGLGYPLRITHYVASATFTSVVLGGG